MAIALSSRLSAILQCCKRYTGYAACRAWSMADLSTARRQMVARQIVVGDGTKGLPAAAPYDAIVVAAGGPQVPVALREQLAIGGRLVMPVGDTPREQRLVRIRRTREEEYEEEDLLPVRFVPLIGEQGWEEEAPRARRGARAPARLPEPIAPAAEPF